MEIWIFKKDLRALEEVNIWVKMENDFPFTLLNFLMTM